MRKEGLSARKTFVQTANHKDCPYIMTKESRNSQIAMMMKETDTWKGLQAHLDKPK